MELTHAVFVIFIAATSAQHDATFGSAVGSDGPYASIKFWWREYPCNGSLTYDLLICRVDHECIGDTTSVATYALRHGPVIPVVFWNHYHLTVNATCGEKSERYQEFYADTGPGELLPLKSRPLVLGEDDANFTFLKYDTSIQNAAENIEILVCSVGENECYDPEYVPITTTSYDTQILDPWALHNVSVRLTKQYNGQNYTSEALTTFFLLGSEVGDDPATSVSISGDGANAEINLSWGPTSCGDSDLVYHNVTFCLSGFGCVKEAVYGGLNYTLTTRDDFPVVFWNSYYANIEAVCGVEQDFILGTKQLYIETGPGDLLPLATLSVVPDNYAVNISIERPDRKLQNSAENVEVTLCQVEAMICLETMKMSVGEENFRVESLWLGVLYNVSARFTKTFNGVNYTSEPVMSSFTLEEGDNAVGIGYNVTGNGRYAELKVVWDENQYPCNNSGVTYNLTFCLEGFDCIEDVTHNETTYILRNQPNFPVVFWRSYYLSIVGVCAGFPINEQRVDLNTGVGDLLPLAMLNAIPDGDAVNISFVRPDSKLQDEAEKIEVTLCDVKAMRCVNSTTLPIEQNNLRVAPLQLGVLYNVSARLRKEFVGTNYTSELTTDYFTLDRGEAPSGIATSATANGTSAEVTLTWNGTEYPCNSGQISYNLKICLDGQGCIQDSTNNETVYTIRSQKSFPVVTWNSYYVSIVGFCAGSVVKQQGLYAPTGPGDLLPLASLDVVPDNNAVNILFEKPKLQNVSETNVEVTVCPVEGTTCLKTSTVPIDTESLRVEQLALGVQYSVAARLTKEFKGVNYTSDALLSSFILEENDDSTGIGFNVTGKGPLAEIELVWDENQYPCNDSLVTYNLTFCLDGFDCIKASTINSTTYTLTSLSSFPVVFWNSYYVTIVGFCKEFPVKEQAIWINAGPGELLPLKTLSAEPVSNAVNFTFEAPDQRTQRAAELIELVVCDVLTETCFPVKELPISERGHRFGDLKRGTFYNVTARLLTKAQDESYKSQALSTSFTVGENDADEFPPIDKASVEIRPSDSGSFVELNVSCSKPKDTHGKVFVEIFVELFDEQQNRLIDHFSSNETWLVIRDVALHQAYRVSVHAVYQTDWERVLSVARNVVFFTGGGDASQAGFKVTGDGPNAEIEVWWDEYRCVRGLTTYKVSACLEGSCTDRSTTDATTIVKSGFAFPVLFWNDYHITIEASCARTFLKLQEFYASTGPGDLLPLQMLHVVPEADAVNVSFNKPNKLSQNAAENVELVFCDVLEPMCFDVKRLPITETSHRFENLTLGVLYNVSARLTKEFEGKNYTSQPLTSNFTTMHPDELEYPPIDSPSVETVSAQDGVAGVKLSVSQPKNMRGKLFRGIFVELLEHRTKLNTTYESTGTHVMIPNLPLYRIFTAKIYAVYSVKNDAVQSVGRELVFFTHMGDLVVPKPEIERALPVNGSSALITWTHTQAPSSAYLFRIVRKQVSNNNTMVVNALPSETRAFLLKNLQPNEAYIVNVTAYVESDRTYENSSDVREFVMLPNTLVPELQVKQLKDTDQLELSWEVPGLQEIKDNCQFLAVNCPDDSECDEQIIASDISTATFDVFPYTNYTLSVRTKCDFESNIRFFRDSVPYRYNSSDVLAPVEHIHQHILNLTEVALSWSVVPDQYYTGFHVEWTQINGSDPDAAEIWTNLEVTEVKANMTGLEPASSYRVYVEGIREFRNKFGERTFRSLPTSTVVDSAVPAPPEINELNVNQVKFTNTVEVSWPGVSSDYGPVGYNVSSTCNQGRTFWTYETQLNFSATNIVKHETDCVVQVASCTVSKTRQQRFCSPATGMSFIFRTLPEPERVEAKYSSDTVYEVAITLPSELKDLENLEYQITGESGEYGPRVSRKYKTTITDTRFDFRVERKARLCLNDLCGDGYAFAFTTNTGEPSEPTALYVDVDVTSLKITWSKPEKTNGPIDGYLVDVLESGSTGFVASKDVKDTSVTIEMEKEYTSYEVRVSAYNFDNVNKETKRVGSLTSASAVTDGAEPPPPNSLEASLSQGRSIIQWQSTPNHRFRVTWFRVLTSSATDNSSTFFTQNKFFKLSVLKPYTDYNFEVSSCTAKDNSKCGKPATLERRTDVGFPDAPTVGLEQANFTSILIRWTVPKQPAGPIDGYRYAIIKKSSGKTPSNYTTASPGELTANLTGLEQKTEYEIHVIAFNLDPEGKPLESLCGVLVTSTDGPSTGAVLTALLAVFGVIALCGLAYFGYNRYMQRIRDAPLISMGPQTHPSPDLEEVDL